MKGIILAGGSATRLQPATLSISKHLLPVYDKPMIYYPLSTLMLAGIREILIIVKPLDLSAYRHLLGDGSQFGIKIVYAEQKYPTGIADAFLIGEKFIDGDPVCLILGDNIFIGDELTSRLKNASKLQYGAQIFVTSVSDPERFGIATLGKNDTLIAIDEKPRNPKSNLAVTGIYFLDNNAVEVAKSIKPSSRGELEITSILQEYLQSSNVSVSNLGRGFTWLDAGTAESLLEASQYVQSLQRRHGLLICSPEEVSVVNGWMQRASVIKKMSEPKSEYYKTLKKHLLTD